MHLKISYLKRQPFCSGGEELRENKGQVVSLTKRLWCGALVFSLLPAWTSCKTKSNYWSFDTTLMWHQYNVMNENARHFIRHSMDHKALRFSSKLPEQICDFFIGDHEMISWNDLSKFCYHMNRNCKMICMISVISSNYVKSPWQ